MVQIESVAFDMGSVIRGYYSAMTPSEKKVADFVLEHIRQVNRMTLADVADQCGVSDATVLRFCRSLGYHRWLEFKIDLTRSNTNPAEQLLDEISQGDSPGLLAKKVFASSIQALKDTSAVLDEQEFKSALDLIEKADKILVAGVGTSGPIANELYNRMFRLGINCIVQTDSYLQLMEAALLQKDDLLIVISQTGDSSTPLRTTRLAKEAGCSVIVLTGNCGSKLTDYADVVLLSVSHETRIESMSSRIAQYALSHALFVGLMMRNIPDAVDKDQRIWDALMEGPVY